MSLSCLGSPPAKSRDAVSCSSPSFQSGEPRGPRPPWERGSKRPPEPASTKAATTVAAPSRGQAWQPRERARRGLRLPAARHRLHSTVLGSPSELLPAGRGSLPCPRLGSRRSAKSPWRRAISVAEPGSAQLPAPRVPPAPLLRVALGTWHSLPPESRAALPAGRSSPPLPGPLRRRRQRHLPRATGKGLSMRGWGGRGGGG